MLKLLHILLHGLEDQCTTVEYPALLKRPWKTWGAYLRADWPSCPMSMDLESQSFRALQSCLIRTHTGVWLKSAGWLFFFSKQRLLYWCFYQMFQLFWISIVCWKYFSLESSWPEKAKSDANVFAVGQLEEPAAAAGLFFFSLMSQHYWEIYRN